MLTSSLDVLNLVLAVCIAALTFFLCWAIYYFVVSVQKLHALIKRVEMGVAKAEEIISLAREKLKNSSAYFMILAEIAKKAMEFVKDRKAEPRKTKKK